MTPSIALLLLGTTAQASGTLDAKTVVTPEMARTMRIWDQVVCDERVDVDPRDGKVDEDYRHICERDPSGRGFRKKSVFQKVDEQGGSAEGCLQDPGIQSCQPLFELYEEFMGDVSTGKDIIPLRDGYLVPSQDGRFWFGGGGELGERAFVVDLDPGSVEESIFSGEGEVSAAVVLPEEFGLEGFDAQVIHLGEFGVHLVIHDPATGSSMSTLFGHIGATDR